MQRFSYLNGEPPILHSWSSMLLPIEIIISKIIPIIIM
jgi:hypothetical protein